MTGANEKKFSTQSRRTPPRGGGRTYDRDSEFVDVELTASEVAEYRQWRTDIEEVDLAWREAEDNGYKFTCRYDERSSAYAAFMFPDNSHDNYGFILAGRGGSPYRALTEVLFKHVSVLRGDWRGRAGGPNRSDDPDW